MIGEKRTLLLVEQEATGGSIGARDAVFSHLNNGTGYTVPRKEQKLKSRVGKDFPLNSSSEIHVACLLPQQMLATGFGPAGWAPHLWRTISSIIIRLDLFT